MIIFWKYPQNYPKIWRKYFIRLIKAGIDKRTEIVTTSNYSKDGLSIIFKNVKIKSIYQSSNTNYSGLITQKIYNSVGTFEKEKIY